MMKFTKMHGIGNDYVYVNGFEETVADPAALAPKVSHRHFGIGADGLILVLPSDRADVRMRIFNADGSEAEMCGNGIRCVAKYAYEHGLARKEQMRIETGGGIKTVQLAVANGKVESVRVNMGRPILERGDIPMDGAPGRVVDEPFHVDGLPPLRVTCVSMGNPHCVIFVDAAKDVPLAEWGPKIECHDVFPNRINVHFVQVISRDELQMVTWERGSGITLACGTGASAVCVAGVLSGRSERHVHIHLPGGDLDLEWADDDNVYMTGPAVEVFAGEWFEQ